MHESHENNPADLRVIRAIRGFFKILCRRRLALGIDKLGQRSVPWRLLPRGLSRSIYIGSNGLSGFDRLSFHNQLNITAI
jgi:hypothetical protein